MRMAQLNWKKRNLARSGNALFLLGLFCSVLAFASSSSLHQAFHPNAANSDHQCAAKLLSSGQVDTASTDSAIVVVTFETTAIVSQGSLFVRNFFYLPPGRGPPPFLA
jgi:hypothetical protein